jgi:hypothetical protein
MSDIDITTLGEFPKDDGPRVHPIFTDESVRNHHGLNLIQVTPELIARLQDEREDLDSATEGDLRLWAVYEDVKRLIEATGAQVLEVRSREELGL